MAGLQQRTPAWHMARKGKLTASNLGAALGQVSYISRSQAFKRATGQEAFTGNVATEWGTNNEANGICQYQSLTGNVVQATGLHVHDSYDWLAGSPDGFVGDEGMIEVKCPFYYRRDGSGRLHKQVPGHYFMQINALLEITQRDWCDYVCWSPEGMVVYRVTRDPTLFDYLLGYYSQFFASISSNASGPPPMSKATREEIHKAVEESMKDHVDLNFWANVDMTDHMPIPEETSDDDELPPAKRMRASYD